MDLTVLIVGNQVSGLVPTMLSNDVSSHEIDIAIWAIDDSKPPGIDGFNSHFCKKEWHIIKLDVYDVARTFFYTSEFYHVIKCTLVSLVPKVHNPFHVKDFRPIACCKVLFTKL